MTRKASATAWVSRARHACLGGESRLAFRGSCGTIAVSEMDLEVVGGHEELESVVEFVDASPDAPSALVLVGDAGIGKSTLWLAGLDRARARGLRVLSARPAEAESGLAYAGLGDLLEAVLDETLPSLR